MTIESVGRENCSGCSLCSLLCPHKCIVMKEDSEGFMQPVINHETCIDCGVCYKLCPCKEENKEKSASTYYSTAIKDKQLLKRSSSGGMFIVIASAFIDQGGYVCGCVFDESMKAVHICTNNKDDLKRMMGSKYVQSDILECLKEVKSLLREGNSVLFTGTACQVAAVKQYSKDTDNLYCVDILCHGVPSPLYLKKYVQYLEEKHRGKLTRLEFRNKEELGWGSEHRTYYEINRGGKIKGYRPSLPAYFCSFFWGINLRESCYNCKFTGANRISDITIGDFWGYWSYYHKRFPEGLSVASVNTEKGKYLWSNIVSELGFCEELPADAAKGTNTNFYHPTPRPQTRGHFYDDIVNKPYQEFIWRTYLDKSSRKKMMVSLYGRFVPEFLQAFIRKFKTKD